MYSPYRNPRAANVRATGFSRGNRAARSFTRDPQGCYGVRTLGVIVLWLVVLTLMTTASAVQANDDGCFRLPNGTKFCAKPPARDRTEQGGPQKKPIREVAPDRRGARNDKQGNKADVQRARAIRDAGGLSFLVEQFDVRAVPALTVVGPCLCRDGNKPVYGFCTEGSRTYKPSCS